ncbi:hypothetical protein MTO96_013152 [Rhipicephalus appendiculatus]
MTQLEADFYWRRKASQAEVTGFLAWRPPHCELSVTISGASSEGPVRCGRLTQGTPVQQELVQEVQRACFDENPAAVPCHTFSGMRVERTGSAAAVRHKMNSWRKFFRTSFDSLPAPARSRS